jgi:hypothetical protein
MQGDKMGWTYRMDVSDEKHVQDFDLNNSREDMISTVSPIIIFSVIAPIQDIYKRMV